MEEVTLSTEEEMKVAREEPARTSSREGIFGLILLVVLIVAVAASTVGVGMAAYSKWKMSKERSEQLSIATLDITAQENASQESSQKEEAVEAPSQPVEPPAAVDAKNKDISVLNGGAAKGTAAVVADLLKQAGYVKVVAGNTANDYAGATVYHAIGLEKEADLIKADLTKKYPNIVVKPATTGNKETSTAPITVIIGR